MNVKWVLKYGETKVRERDREARLHNKAVYMKQIKDAKLKWVDEFTERTECNYI